MTISVRYSNETLKELRHRNEHVDIFRHLAHRITRLGGKRSYKLLDGITLWSKGMREFLAMPNEDSARAILSNTETHKTILEAFNVSHVGVCVIEASSRGVYWQLIGEIIETEGEQHNEQGENNQI